MTILDEGTAAAARSAMIDSQLRVSGVNDPAVLAAMNTVGREAFVPANLRANAYIDRALPLDDGHALPAPLVHGRMLTEAAPVRGELVLVVAVSNYLPKLVEQFGCEVLQVTPADAVAGTDGPQVTLLMIEGAVEHLPDALVARLAEGGRIVTGTVERSVSRLAVGRKVGGRVALLPVQEIGMPVLSEFAAPRRWSF